MDLSNLPPVLQTIIMVAGTVLLLATILAPVTPTKKDDEFLEKLKKIPLLGVLLAPLLDLGKKGMAKLLSVKILGDILKVILATWPKVSVDEIGVKDESDKG